MERERNRGREEKREREREAGRQVKRERNWHSSSIVAVVILQLFILIIYYSTKSLCCNWHYNKFDEAMKRDKYMKLSSNVLIILQMFNIYY